MKTWLGNHRSSGLALHDGFIFMCLKSWYLQVHASLNSYSPRFFATAILWCYWLTVICENVDPQKFEKYYTNSCYFVVIIINLIHSSNGTKKSL